MADETREIEALLGPYRGKRLTVSSADAEAAINDHWVIDPFAAPDDHPHPPLTEEERTAAFEAANTWAQAQWSTAQGGAAPPDPPDPPDQTTDGEPLSRSMAPDESAGYTTRGPGRPRRS